MKRDNKSHKMKILVLLEKDSSVFAYTGNGRKETYDKAVRENEYQYLYKLSRADLESVSAASALVFK